MVYFDNSATTKVDDSILNNSLHIFTDNYGNPSSLHHFGLQAELIIKDCTNSILSLLNCNNDDIIFTSGGTESNNLAILGTALKRKKGKNHIISCKIEHPSVLEALLYLESEGFCVDYVNINKNGTIDLEHLTTLIKPETCLVTLFFVNSETGAVNTVWDIGKLIKNLNKETIFHVDAVQGFGKYKIEPKTWNIDLLSFSGHKIHAPKGIGGLYVKKGIGLKSLILGGEQQKKIRPGTENVFGIYCLKEASQYMYAHCDENFLHALEIKNEIIKRLEKYPIYVNSSEDGSPYILNFSVKGVKGEPLLQALSEKKIYVSTGTACSSKKKAISPVLFNMGIPLEYIEGAIRLSFSKYNTLSECDMFIDALDEILRFLIIKRSK